MLRIFTFLVCSALSVSSLQAGVFKFDPDGSGAKPEFTVGGFDFLVGNALSKNVIDNDANWTIYYQASLGNLSDDKGNAIPIDGPNGTGLNVNHEITVVAMIPVKTVIKTGNVIQYVLNGEGFIRLYHDNQVNAKPLDGTGYNDGELILDAKINNNDLMGYLMLAGNTTFPLDSFGANNWGAIKSRNGLGSFQATANVASKNDAFFKANVAKMSFNSSQVAPYRQIDPSKQFWDGTGFILPNVGAINLQNGCCTLTQADANGSFDL